MVNNSRNPTGLALGKAHVHLKFHSEEEDPVRYRKAFMGVVVNPGMTYNIQMIFEIEGYFSIKATSLGANLCLLEES